MTGNNVFESSIKSNLRKLFELHRLDLRLIWILFKYLVKSVLKIKVSENEKNIYYYYLTLINCKCFHSEFRSGKFYFGRRDVSLVARSGKRFSDLENLNQLFGREEYKEIINLYEKKFHGIPLHIIDAGANVGYATLYFHSFYPTAKYICIEPDRDNYSMLKENLRLNNVEQCSLVNSGLWNKPAFLALANESTSASTWGFSYVESHKPTNIPAVDFKALVQEQGFISIDILKLDIEGSEAILFDDMDYMKDILSVTKVIGIEIHDHLASREAITKQLMQAGFVLHNISDMTFGYNRSLVE